VTIEEIKKDLSDTERELKDFQDERDVLMRNPQQNRVRIYTLDGKILKRIDLLKRINQALLELQ